MKINILEDTVDGNVQDGSIDMREELRALIKKIRWEGGFEDRRPEIAAAFDAPDITTGRLNFYFDEPADRIKWEVVGYYGDKETDEILKFEFSHLVVSKAYLFFVNRIKEKFPEILNYNRLILNEIKVNCSDIDLFGKNILITGKDFIEDHPTYYANFTAQWGLYTYLTETEEIAQSYVIPYNIKFEETYAEAYKRNLARLRKVAKAYQKGVFDGHEYYYKEMRVMMSTGYKAYDTENNIMKTKFSLNISPNYLFIDNQNVQDKIIPWYNRDKEAELNFETKYKEALDKYLGDALKPYKIGLA